MICSYPRRYDRQGSVVANGRIDLDDAVWLFNHL
jgi:hypothetical protein